METNKELMRAEFEAAYGPKEGFAWLNPDNTYKSQAIQDGWEIWQKAWQAALSQRPTDDNLWDETLRDRDHNAEMADQLADAIGKHFGVDVGEHSNANCPWHEALRVIEEADKYASAAPAPSAAAGEQVQAGEKLREAVLHDGLFDAKESFRRIHESETIGHARNLARIAMLEVSNVLSRYLAQPTPAQGDAVPVNSDALATMLTVFDMGLGFALCHHGFAETRNAIKDLQEDFTEIRIAVANATRQSSADAVDAARYRELRKDSQMYYVAYRNEGMGWAFSQINMDKLDKYIDAAIAAQGGKGEKE